MDRNNEIIVIHRAPSAPRLSMMGEEKKDINKKTSGCLGAEKSNDKKHCRCSGLKLLTAGSFAGNVWVKGLSGPLGS